jgi:6-phosphogluconolactonase (cycloisomerase 2 family)
LKSVFVFTYVCPEYHIFRKRDYFMHKKFLPLLIMLISYSSFIAPSTCPQSELRPVPNSPFGGVTSPSFNAYSANGNFFAVANTGASTISFYMVHKITGELTPVSGSPFTTGGNPITVAFSSDSQFLAVTNFTANTISIYHVLETGLTLIHTIPSINPYGLAYSHNGQFLIVTNQTLDSVSIYSVNQITGELTLIGSPFLTGGNSPQAITFSPSDEFISVTNFGSNNISVLKNTNGILSTVVGSPFATQAGPIWIAYSPDGTLEIVNNFNTNQLSIYTVNLTTGALTPASTPLISTGATPFTSAFDKSGRLLAVSLFSPNSIALYQVSGTTFTLLCTQTVGNGPIGINFNSNSEFLAVSNGLSGTISVFATSFISAPIIIATPCPLTMATPTISGISGPNQLITIFIHNRAVGTTHADSTGAWSFTFTTPLTNGSYMLTAQASNIFGNMSALSVPLTIIVNVGFNNQSTLVRAIFGKYCSGC